MGVLSTDQRGCCRGTEPGEVHACPGLCDMSKRDTMSLSALARLVDGRLCSWNNGAALEFRGGQSADVTGSCRPIAVVLGSLGPGSLPHRGLIAPRNCEEPEASFLILYIALPLASCRVARIKRGYFCCSVS